MKAHAAPDPATPPVPGPGGGRPRALDPAPEPLLAPPEGTAWAVLWSSEDLRYGGTGTGNVETEEGWRIPGEATVVLSPAPRPDPLGQEGKS